MKKERAGSLIFLLAGLYGFLVSVRLPMGKWNEPGAGIFPLSLSILLCISGVGMFIHEKEKVKTEWSVIGRQLLTPLKIVLLTAAFILALSRLGFLLTSSLYLFAIFLWVGRFRVWTAIGLSLAVGIGSWYVFGRLFGLPLPKGPWIL